MPQKKQNIPALRFSEFSGNWTKRKIGSFLEIGSGRDYKHLEAGDIPVYGTGGYMTSVDDFLYDGKSVGIGRKGTINKPVFLTGKFWTVDTLFYTRSYKNIIPEFVFALFQRIDWLKYNEASGVPSLSKATIEKIKVHVPDQEEQRKIASFLGAIDQKIASLEKKKGLLEDYKKGCMQKLFSQEIRFTDDKGKSFPVWKEKKLGDVATFKKGKGISKADILMNGKNKCIRYGELYTEYKAVINFIKSRTDTPLEDSVLSKKNDILMPTSDVTPRGLATASAVDEEGVILGGDILIIRSKHLHNRYFCYFVSANKHLVMRLVTGVTVYHIYGSDIATLKFELPCIDEQKKIADFLSAIDDKIALVSEELNKAETFKKGLLQQMFV